MNVKIIPKKLKGTLHAPPSKSHAHRLLIAQKLAYLQSGDNRNQHIPSFSQDIEATKNCLSQMDKNMPFLDCKESGSTLRFMLPVAMALKDEAVFIGTGKLPDRPISPLKEEMEKHGCTFITPNRFHKSQDKYREICTVKGRLMPGNYRLAGNVSSQFITGLLFALPLLDGRSTLTLTTKLESAGYVDLTLDVLKAFGIKITEKLSTEGFNIYVIDGKQVYKEPETTSIQCDWSNAAFWLAGGALGGDVTLCGLDLASSQRDKQIAGILENMGAELKIQTTDDSLSTIKCTGHNLTSCEINVSQIPDLVPILATVMSLSEGTSLITNAERLRIKESDRLHTVFDVLSKLGADITDGGSGLSVTGRRRLIGGQISGHNDHRIVMSAAIASCACHHPVIIYGAEAVNKSYPTFFEDFAALGGEVYEV
ncbi:3-phosphoshikimate 1-carboxyvinyltransferase [Mogibacterium sp. NSJ-24]|jgi:3-phosphoshikimate 1-carboxyvinyltransferase|uniref:3-phosphoshikimate 1-carboxyvinyltransferase n=1 Tax=Lentihominibacter hominis TaxID=2763645 RepID=A0A926EA06_9FIRM|nr:3-phosphoshikimate 1-carboxyvinyltransferase [Lentihominibacter hominis]